jgi:hypothetical protein
MHSFQVSLRSDIAVRKELGSSDNQLLTRGSIDSCFSWKIVELRCAWHVDRFNASRIHVSLPRVVAWTDFKVMMTSIHVFTH